MGSSKKVTIGYEYHLGMHLVLLHGPADELVEVRVDDRSAWIGSHTGGQLAISARGLFGGEAREGGVEGVLDLDMGGPTQLQNTYLQSQLGENIPAYRGVVGVILNKFYLGMNPYLKKWSFKLTRILKRSDGSEQWYPSKAQINPMFSALSYDTSYWKYLISTGAPGTNSHRAMIDYDDSAWAVGLGGFGKTDSGGIVVNTIIDPMYGRNIWLRKDIEIENPQLAGDIQLNVGHDDFATIWWNGIEIPFENIPGQFFNTTIVPRALLLEHNVVTLQVVDSIPFGSPTNILAGMSLQMIGGSQVDMNPSHIIRECLTDKIWGMGYHDADVNDEAFIACADTLWEEGMGISLLWDKQMPLEDFINEIIRHINAVLYVDRTTGKFTLKLIRDDYDVDDLLTLGEANIKRVTNYNRKGSVENINSVSVVYWDYRIRGNSSVTVEDIALIQEAGAVINTTVQYPGFTNSNIAIRSAQRDLITFSTPLLGATIEANRDASSLDIGDLFKFEWSDYHTGYVVMRVHQIAFGDGKNNVVKITATEDIFSTPANPIIFQEVNGWEDIKGEPENPLAVIAIEAPYFELVQQSGQVEVDAALGYAPEMGRVLVAAVKPPKALNATAFVASGEGYQEVGVFDFSPAGTIRSPLTRTSVIVFLDNAQSLNKVAIGSHGMIGNEIVRVDSLDLGTNRLTLGRGVLDTIPDNHTAGEYLIFWDAYSIADDTEYVDGEDIAAQALTNSSYGQLELNDDNAVELTMGSRAIAPYPPAAVKFNSLYWPPRTAGDIVITWNDRNRVQQTSPSLLDFYDATITKEPGVTVNIRASDIFEVELYLETGVTGNTHTIPSGTIPDGYVLLELWTVRDGYESYYRVSHSLLFGNSLLFDWTGESPVTPPDYDDITFDWSAT